jgi:phosphoribosylaminoimidazole-succinocarboxamide synthase
VPPGLEVLSQGKVRISQRLPDGNRLITATDGISARDYVLDALIPTKGIVLTAMTDFWLKSFEQFGINHHMLASGAGIDSHLPEALRGDRDRQSRAMVVRELKMADAEFVVSGCIAGSAMKPYMLTGEVCGQKLPPGLQDGDELPFVLFRPTTKAQEGHDENVSAEEIIRRYPVPSMLAVKAYQIGYNHAKVRGILLPDTKFEISEDGIIGDEVLTPDSSRFWPYVEWLTSRKPATGRKAPGSFDKDPIRAWLDDEIAKWCKANGVAKMNPENPAHVDVVHTFVMPQELIRQTTQAYRYIFWRLTGMTIEQYLCKEMGVDYPRRDKQNILIVCGSESDLPQVRQSCPDTMGVDVTVHVISCHRNPEELRDLVLNGNLGQYGLVAGVGSKTLALPGEIDALCHAHKQNVRVAGVALGEGQDLVDAQRAILGIPGQPVIFNEMTGEAYTGPMGLRELLDRIANGELPPAKPRKEKPVRLNVQVN